MNDIDVVNVTISAPAIVRSEIHTGVQGPQGRPGEAGDPGAQGSPGQGVPVGGTAGQVLKKKSETDYDTEWSTGGGSVDSVNGKTGIIVLGAADVSAAASDHTHALLYAALSHDHTGVYAPASHTHAWGDITDKPTTFAPSAHTHAESEITNLTVDLAGKAAADHNHTDTYEPANANIQTHVASTSNPHSTTAAQVGAMATTHPANAITALGTSGVSTVAAREDDARFTDSRTPVAHKSSHATGGGDALTASDIGAAASDHTHATLYAALSHDHSGVYSVVGHNHDGTYEPVLGNPSADGKVLASTATGVRSWITLSSGSSTFTGLTDAPSSFSGAGGKRVAVNSGATALEFVSEPYDVACYAPGVPTASQVLLQFVATRAVALPQNLTGSQGKAGTAATASTAIDIQKNGASIGTITFAASGTIPTYTFSSAQSLAAGDVLKLVAPATPDATLANISLTLVGSR